MIVYGRNHFLVKKVNPKEIGVNYEDAKDSIFELRQRYFHLYLIPLVPTGQDWLVRKDGDLYHVTENIESRLKSKFPTAANWKAFALPIILIVGFIVYSISDEINSRNYEELSQKENLAEIDLMKTKINKLDTFSYLEFSKDYEDVYYKVTQVTNDSVKLAEFESPLITLDSILKMKNYTNYIDILYVKLKKTKIENTIWIKKKELIAGIKDKNAIEEKYIKTLSPSKPMTLKRIIKFDDAQFIVNTDEESESIYYYELQNLGLDAIIDSISSVKTETWQISKKRDVKLLEKFAVRTENGSKATLYYSTTENNKKHTIKLKRIEGKVYIDFNEDIEN